MSDTAGSLTENLIDCIEALGSPRPASKGLSELYQSLANALSTFSGGSAPQSGTLPSQVDLASGVNTTLFTITLSIGTWFVDSSISMNPGTNGDNLGWFYRLINSGTGTGTISGKYADQITSATSGVPFDLAIFAEVDVTIAGTFILQVNSLQDSSSFVRAVSPTSLAGISGWRAMMV